MLCGISRFLLGWLMKLKIVFVFLFVCGLHAAPRPNIVFILADDLGIGNVKCFGGECCQIVDGNVMRARLEELFGV